VRDFQDRVRHQVGAADRDAAGNGLAVEAESHGPIPLIRLRRTVGDQFEHGLQRLVGTFAFGVDGHGRALAGGQHHHPHDALGVDAAVPRSIQTSQGNLPASWVSLAEARACSPAC
jgi:hypothetical protein